MAYDHMNRPLLTKQQYITQTTTYGTVTGGTITLSKIDYNELGQVMIKHLHSINTAANPANNTFLQHNDYLYNERGWTTKINDPATLTDPVYGTLAVFSEQLDYDQSTNNYTGVQPMYNGNISSLRWQTNVNTNLSPLPAQEVKGYIFTYDPLNRLTNAASQAPSGTNKYNEALTYDELGNIITLARNNSGTTPLNNLNYNYTSGA